MSVVHEWLYETDSVTYIEESKRIYVLAMYVRDVKSGTTMRDGQPSIEKETVSTALVNGNNLLGPVSHVVIFIFTQEL